MAHEEYGCPCCQAGLGNLFAYDAADATAAEIRILPIGRRRFMAGASALAGTAVTTAS